MLLLVPVIPFFTPPPQLKTLRIPGARFISENKKVRCGEWAAEGELWGVQQKVRCGGECSRRFAVGSAAECGILTFSGPGCDSCGSLHPTRPMPSLPWRRSYVHLMPNCYALTPFWHHSSYLALRRTLQWRTTSFGSILTSWWVWWQMGSNRPNW